MDALFARPFVDVDEERKQPCTHRYVHGGFAGTDTRFSIYLPPSDIYAGRFVSWVEGGVGGHETRAAHLTGGLGSLPFIFSVGAYLVESNGGHLAGHGLARSRGGQDGSITSYRATAAAARHARAVARLAYGSEPHHGYLAGPSGGAWRTILCLENTDDLWDGGVPYTSFAGHGILMPTLVENCARVLGPRLKQIIEAVEPGGHGDPFRGLEGAPREELARLYKAGLQRGAEFQLAHPAIYLGAFEIFMTMHAEFDPLYFREFWEKPGHAGHDGELAGAVVSERTRIRRLVSLRELRSRFGAGVDSLLGLGAAGLTPDARVGLEVGSLPASGARGAHVTLLGNRAPTRRLLVAGLLDDVLVATAASAVDNPLGAAVAGDMVQLDNRDYLAFCHLYRHQVDKRTPESAQFTVAGQPVYPQRPLSVDDIHVGVRTSGRFHGRMIYLDNLHDCCSSPLGALTYVRRAVRADPGSAGRLRLWLIENASHAQASHMPQSEEFVTSSRLVDWEGCVERALQALIIWVEHGKEPPASTRYSYRDGQVGLASSASRRGGIQPSISLRRIGAPAARCGEEVRLAAKVAVPPGGGQISAIEWDPEGRGQWSAIEMSRMAADGWCRFTVKHVYEQAGVYHPAVRAMTLEDEAQPFGLVANLARTMVAVEA